MFYSFVRSTVIFSPLPIFISAGTVIVPFDAKTRFKLSMVVRYLSWNFLELFCYCFDAPCWLLMTSPGIDLSNTLDEKTELEQFERFLNQELSLDLKHLLRRLSSKSSNVFKSRDSSCF